MNTNEFIGRRAPIALCQTLLCEEWWADDRSSKRLTQPTELKGIKICGYFSGDLQLSRFYAQRLHRWRSLQHSLALRCDDRHIECATSLFDSWKILNANVTQTANVWFSLKNHHRHLHSCIGAAIMQTPVHAISLQSPGLWLAMK